MLTIKSINQRFPRYGKIDITAVKELANEIDDSWVSLSASELYTKIISKDIKNLGPVYALALVFFITRGREPIYDRYAEIAIDAILNPEHEFRIPREYKELPDKHSYDSVINRYDVYKDKLTHVFGESWKYERDIDCALWAYGHMFS